MARYLTVLSVYSFVDLITNSSSELFICPGNKTIEAVKKILVQIAEMHNAKCAMSPDGKVDYYGPIDLNCLFNGIFAEPTISEISFDLDEYPNKGALLEVQPYWDPAFDWNNNHLDHPLKVAGDEAVDAWRAKNKDREQDDQYWKEWQKVHTDAFRQFAALKEQEELAFYRWVFAQNKIRFDYKSLKSIKSKRITRLISEINSALNWRYTLTKGDVLLSSDSDNSVPYCIWDDIERTLQCERRHLG